MMVRGPLPHTQGPNDWPEGVGAVGGGGAVVPVGRGGAVGAGAGGGAGERSVLSGQWPWQQPRPVSQPTVPQDELLQGAAPVLRPRHRLLLQPGHTAPAGGGGHRLHRLHGGCHAGLGGGGPCQWGCQGLGAMTVTE